MRRTVLGWVAIWLTGGAVACGSPAHAADERAVTVLGVIPEGPPFVTVLHPAPDSGQNRSAYLENKAPQTPVVLPLQPYAPTPFPPPPPTVTVAAPPPAAATQVDPAAPAVPSALGCSGCENAGADRWFGGVDYLLFKLRRNPSPPLVQTLPASAANFEANGGALPPGAATTIFGETGIDQGELSGVRVHLGLWLTPEKCWGLDGSYLQLFQKADSIAVASQGVPVLGRGFVDAGTGQEAFLRYTTPDGRSTGFIGVDAPVELYTFDGNIRAQGPSVFSERADYLFGLRYLNLRDSVTIDSGAVIRDAAGGPPFTIQSHESFRATNQFYGSQVGFESRWRYGCFTLDVTGKFAVGWVHQDVRIDGFATSQVDGQPQQVFPNQSILFVQPTNAGRYQRDKFAVMPEFLIQLGYQITPRIRAMVGYDYFTVTSVERSGAAIDPGVNPALTQFVQVRKDSRIVQPSFAFGGTDIWAQGLTVGLALTY